LTAAEEADHNALDDEFGGGEEIGIARVFRAKEGASTFLEEAFKGGLAVDEGGDDLAGRGFTRGEEDDVVFEDIGADHGIAANAEAKESGVAGEAEGGGIDGDGFVGLGVLGVGGRETRGDDTEHGDLEQGRAAEALGGGEGPRFAGLAGEDAFFLQRLEVASHGEGAGKAEVSLNLT